MMVDRFSRILEIVLRLGFRVALVLGLVLLGGYSIHSSYNGSVGKHHFQFTGLHFHGAVHLDQAELEHMIRSTSPDNLLRIDLQHTRRLVESETWVKDARVRRKLPGDLHVYIEEREPAAAAGIDNELYLVDHEGVVLDRYGHSYQTVDQPIVRGLKNEARENARQENRIRMQLYLRVLRELAEGGGNYTSTISEIDVSNARRVAVIPVGEPVLVFLGNKQFLKRYGTFQEKRELYEQLKERHGGIEWVDVSYDRKVIFHTSQGEKRLATVGIAPPVAAPLLAQTRENGEKEVSDNRR